MELSEIEMRACTKGNVNTYPGAYGISVALLDAYWASIKTHVTSLFRACVDLKYHPNCFKLAEVMFLPKFGRGSTSVKGWRPIFLLSCLGMGLERLIAKRTLDLAIVSKILGKQQFGALSKRSTINLVSICCTRY